MRTLAAAGFALLFLLGACAVDAGRRSETRVQAAGAGRRPTIVSRAATPQRPLAKSQSRESDLARLRTIAAQRRGIDPATSYTLGPGDEVSITVFDLKEMTRKVRVSQRSEIQLPMVGTLRVGGKSEAEVASEIAARLRKDYLQDPQVDVFVEEYRSQQVAVTGAVAEPGLVPLTRDRYTILDAISEAGGLTRDAGSFIEFLPAEPRGRSQAFETARSSARGAEGLAGQGIQLEVDDLMRGAGDPALDLPVVPGDVIYVPESGSFAIEGWVEAPGSYPLTRGMSVLGALSSAGGPLFPAALSRIQLMRATSGAGQAREIVELDLGAIKDGRQGDIALRGGDVVRVPANPFLVPPWALYSLLRTFISVGAGVPVT